MMIGGMPAVKFMKTGGNFLLDRRCLGLQSCVKVGSDELVRRQRENTAEGYASFYPAHSSGYFSGYVYQIILAFTFVLGKYYYSPY